MKITDLKVGHWYQIKYEDDGDPEYSYSGPGKYLGESGNDYPIGSVSFALLGLIELGHFDMADVIDEIPRPESDKSPEEKFVEWVREKAEGWMKFEYMGRAPSDYVDGYEIGVRNLGEDVSEKLKELGI